MLPLVAEAQSCQTALKCSLGTRAIRISWEVFEWLKATAVRNHIYISALCERMK